MQFLLLLTRSLNYRTLDELLNTMSSSEFCLWAAEFERNPWDEHRADLRAGIISSVVANHAGRVRKDNLPPATPIDFMPYDQPEPEVIEPDFNYLTNFLGEIYAR